MDGALKSEELFLSCSKKIILHKQKIQDVFFATGITGSRTVELATKFLANNPLTRVDQWGLLQENKDDYSWTLDQEEDTVAAAAEKAGYESWQDSLTHFRDAEGNTVDISDRFDEDGNWIKGANSIQGLILEYNPDDMHEYSAQFKDFYAGINISGEPEKSGTIGAGYSGVIFDNQTTGESFQAAYTFYPTETSGVIASGGVSVTAGVLKQMLLGNYSREDVASTYEGIFNSTGISLPIGIGAYKISGEPNWSGYGVGFGLGKGGGLGTIQTEYSLIPGSIATFLGGNNYWLGQ